MRQAVGLRVGLVAAAMAGLATVAPGRVALAQPARAGGAQPAPAARYKPVPLNLQRQQLGSAVLPEQARSRMRAGDYEGALDTFDAALRTLVDPTLYRDRGLCHEQLGHVYPAIDDYRVYLTESPEAPDAEGISRRLRALEDKVAGRTQTASTEDDDTPAGLRASATVHVGTEGVSGSSTTGTSTKGAHGTTAGSDKLDYKEPDEDALRTPLRGGKGWSLAPFFSEHKWFGGTTFNGATDSLTWSESLGLQVRYAVGARGAVVAEIGYEHFNATSVDGLQISGLTSLLGYELRFPLDPAYDDQVLLVPELGYENLEVSFSNASESAQSIGGWVPRLRVGWRHMLAPDTALDLSLDGGFATFFTYDHFPYDSNASWSGIVALNVSVAWGL